MIKDPENLKKISDSLSVALINLKRAGGFALVFVFVGLLFTIFSFLYPQGGLSVPTFVIGSILILISFLLFSYTHLKGIVKTQKAFKQSAETLDTLQEISLNLISITKDIQAYSFKNLDKIKITLNAVLPIIRPFLGQQGQDIGAKIENISSGIVDISSKTEKVIRDVENALTNNDYKVLKDYEKDIMNLNELLRNALRS